MDNKKARSPNEGFQGIERSNKEAQNKGFERKSTL